MYSKEKQKIILTQKDTEEAPSPIEGLSDEESQEVQSKAGASLKTSIKTPEPPIPKNGNPLANEWLEKANRAAREGLLEEARDLYERALNNPFFGYTKIEGITDEGLQSIQERYDEILKIAGYNTNRSTQGITWKGRLNPLYRRLAEVLKEVRENAEKDTNDPLLVVDIGIGKGGTPTTFELVDILRESGFTNIKVIGVDNNPKYVYKAKNNLKIKELPEGTIEFREGNGFNLDTLGIKNADLIITSNVLLHVYYNEEEQKAEIAKTLKNLSEGGIFVTAEAPRIGRVISYTIYSKDGSIREEKRLSAEELTVGSPLTQNENPQLASSAVKSLERAYSANEEWSFKVISLSLRPLQIEDIKMMEIVTAEFFEFDNEQGQKQPVLLWHLQNSNGRKIDLLVLYGADDKGQVKISNIYFSKPSTIMLSGVGYRPFFELKDKWIEQDGSGKLSAIKNKVIDLIHVKMGEIKTTRFNGNVIFKFGASKIHRQELERIIKDDPLWQYVFNLPEINGLSLGDGQIFINPNMRRVIKGAQGQFLGGGTIGMNALDVFSPEIFAHELGHYLYSRNPQRYDELLRYLHQLYPEEAKRIGSGQYDEIFAEVFALILNKDSIIRTGEYKSIKTEIITLMIKSGLLPSILEPFELGYTGKYLTDEYFERVAQKVKSLSTVGSPLTPDQFASSAVGVEKPLPTSEVGNGEVPEAKDLGGIDLSQIELTLKDSSYISILNPADLKVLRAAKALKDGWESLSLLYVHEIMLLIKDNLIRDIQNRDLLSGILNQLKLKNFLDPQALQFLQFIQSQKPISEIRVVLPATKT